MLISTYFLSAYNAENISQLFILRKLKQAVTCFLLAICSLGSFAVLLQNNSLNQVIHNSLQTTIEAQTGSSFNLIIFFCLDFAAFDIYASIFKVIINRLIPCGRKQNFMSDLNFCNLVTIQIFKYHWNV